MRLILNNTGTDHTRIRSYFFPHLFDFNMYDDKKAIYQANITRSLAEMYQHMEDMLDFLPEGEEIDGDKLTDEQLEIIERVEAIEQEWIIDPKARAEVTLIQWEDND